MTEYRLALPYGDAPPIHANQRLNENVKRRVTANVRRDMGWIARSARLGSHHRIAAWLEWRPSTVRRRDGGENLAPLVKALVDGVVDAGVVPDDTPDHVTRREPVLLDPDPDTAGLWFVIDTQPEADDPCPRCGDDLHAHSVRELSTCLRALGGES